MRRVGPGVILGVGSHPIISRLAKLLPLKWLVPDSGKLWAVLEEMIGTVTTEAAELTGGN